MGSVVQSVQSTTDVTLTTTTETVVATISGVNTPRRTTVTIKGWAQLTSGTATTTVTVRIRRGTTITGTLVDEANAITIGAAAGTTEEYEITVQDENIDLAGGSYVLTLQQAAATGNGSCLQASIEVSFPE